VRVENEDNGELLRPYLREIEIEKRRGVAAVSEWVKVSELYVFYFYLLKKINRENWKACGAIVPHSSNVDPSLGEGEEFEIMSVN